MTFARAILLGAMAAGLSACTARFSADFERDAVGPAPTQPAGAPDDRILIPDSRANIFVVDLTPELSGAKSLLFAVPSTSPLAYLIAEPLSSTARPVHATWKQRLSDGAEAAVVLWAGHFNPVVSVRFAGGRMFVNRSDSGACRAASDVVVFITATPDDRFELATLGRGCELRLSGTLESADFFPSRQVGLNVQLLQGSSSANFVIDNVLISERRPPEMP